MLCVDVFVGTGVHSPGCSGGRRSEDGSAQETGCQTRSSGTAGQSFSARPIFMSFAVPVICTKSPSSSGPL